MKKLLIFSICVLSVLTHFGQDKDKLERERQELQRELQEIQSQYNKLKGKTKASLGQLAVLQQKMSLQNKYINNINREIRSLNDDIYLSTLEINHLQAELDTLKAQYARSVIYAYKNKSSYSYLNFIFSANDFNDGIKRATYLKSYRTYRHQQVSNILEKKKLIEDRKQELVGKQSLKRSALMNQKQQMSELEGQRKEKDVVVSKLRSQEKSLSKEIAAKKKRDNQLKSQINAIVRREIEAAKKEAAARAEAERKKNAANNTSPDANANVPKKPEGKPKSYLDLNATDIKLNADFEKNKAKLPWPVDNGLVTIPFGISKVDDLQFDNAGITISTPSAGGPVKSVFDGEVSAVSNLGDAMMVMIRHGKYFTVYSNLSSTNVSKGTIVKTGQVIGRTARADDGSGGQLDFLLMIETKNVNPAPWLRR
jgi:septal ring factor EnvC (AmiA/AmiB activator)